MYKLQFSNIRLFQSPNLNLLNNYKNRFYSWINTETSIHTYSLVESQSQISLGPTVSTTVSYTTGTFFNAYSSQSGVSSTDAFNTNNGCWQLYYSHQAISINIGTNNIGLNPHTSGSNSWTWYISVSSVDNTIGSFPAASAITGLWSSSYTGGTLTTSSINTTTNIPANRYFIVGNHGGPFYRTIKSLASNRTAQVSGSNYVTAINRVFLGNWPSGGTTLVPTQLGGSGTGYTEYASHAHVHSIKFG